MLLSWKQYYIVNITKLYICTHIILSNYCSDTILLIGPMVLFNLEPLIGLLVGSYTGLLVGLNTTEPSCRVRYRFDCRIGFRFGFNSRIGYRFSWVRHMFWCWQLDSFFGWSFEWGLGERHFDWWEWCWKWYQRAFTFWCNWLNDNFSWGCMCICISMDIVCWTIVDNCS